MSRRSGVEREVIKELKTKNDNVIFILEKLSGSYIIYLESYGERIDFIFSSDDEDHMEKVLSFMVEAYNEGFNDGKNSTIMFMKN